MTVIKLTRYASKDAPGDAVQSVMFIDGLGMEGDFYARGGQRQLSLLSLVERQWMDTQAEPGLCFARYKENVLLDTLGVLPPGSRVTIGEAVLEITDTAKHCFEACSLFSRGKNCILAGRSLFARVVKGGITHVGDYATEEKY